MKKVFSVLVLTSLLAVLSIPVIVSAASCPNSCDVVAGVDCTCGSRTIYASATGYCWNGQTYLLSTSGSQAACRAAAAAGGTTGGGLDTPEKLVALIDRIGGYIFQALLAVAGIFLIMAGFFFVTAGGNPENVNKARQMLINALIGVAVAVAAQGLKTLVTNLVS